MKFTKNNKIVIGSSIFAGLITLIPTLYFSLPYGYPLAAMLLTTIAANWYTKLTCESYNLQCRFDENQRLIVSIIGRTGSDLNVIHFTIKSSGGFFDYNRLEQKLLEKGITLNDFNLICINGQLLTEYRYIAIHRQMLFYKDLIAECINLCLIAPTQSIQEAKRKSILFWR